MSVLSTCGIVPGVPSVPSVSGFGQRVRGWFHREPKVVAPRHIRIVDGNSTKGKSTASLAESLGYRVLQPTSAGAAISQLEEQGPAFILLGFDRDAAGGMEALGQIHELVPDLPIIMLA